MLFLVIVLCLFNIAMWIVLIAKFKKLFDDNETQFYFAYADEDDIFQIPDEFVAWLDGDADKFTYNKTLQKMIESFRVDINQKDILRKMKRK
mgnify:CR=1 FL=1